MKIKVSFIKDEHPTDYICLMPSERLDDICEDSECKELIIDDIIGYIPYDRIDTTLENWIKKIRIGGNIIITGVDLNSIARGIQGRIIDIKQANLFLYGFPKKDSPIRMSCLTGAQIARIFERTTHFKIIKYSIENFKYIVKAERIK